MAEEVQFEIRKLYLKDASLESPQSPEVFISMDTSPEIGIDLNLEQRELSEKSYYEVVLKISAEAKHEDNTVFLCEVHQAGVFVIAGIPEEELDLALNIACPNVLLPFAREAISDLVTKAGFPQLLLSPINFEALFQQKNKTAAH
ncbi:MAG: protein-export chaperone SecB [Arenicella sp.]